MRPRTVLLEFVKFFGLVAIVLSTTPLSVAAAQPTDIPAWLRTHMGEGEGQIAQPVLQRARALYEAEVSKGAVRNPCYFAMDATRPGVSGNGQAARRFYTVCEAQHSFRAISSGHGGGRDLKGVADFSNGRRCAKNFGNAMDSRLTTGGDYITSEAKTSFKGYYRASGNQRTALLRTFIQFDGAGDTANAREREIGGHPAALVRGVCLWKDPASPYADHDGYVPLGSLVDYTAGRSNGCTSWSQPDARQIVAMVKDDPTTLYIYPTATDIAAVAQAVKAGRSPAQAGLYWNASCLKEIRAPKFWSRDNFDRIIARYNADHPPPPPRPIPVCRGQ